jgi:hypothetical protein
MRTIVLIFEYEVNGVAGELIQARKGGRRAAAARQLAPCGLCWARVMCAALTEGNADRRQR